MIAPSSQVALNIILKNSWDNFRTTNGVCEMTRLKPSKGLVPDLPYRKRKSEYAKT